MRAVFDANVLLSAVLWRGTPYLCLACVEAGLADLVSSDPVLSEVDRNLLGKFGLSPEDTAAALRHLRASTEVIAIEGRHGWIPADPTDDKVVETALLGGVDVIVSGDHHLLEHRFHELSAFLPGDLDEGEIAPVLRLLQEAPVLRERQDHPDATTATVQDPLDLRRHPSHLPRARERS